MEEHIIADKTLIRTAKVISAVFTPFSIPFLAFLVLFIFSYLRIMPLQYKLIVLGVVYCFTILMPTLTIFIFRKINGFSPEELVERKRRYIPFILTITSYVFCLLMMHRLNIPWYMTGIILSALVVMIICVIVNLKWKLSEHMAGAGAVIGGLVAFSALFSYNPVWWLCLFILVAGVLGSNELRAEWEQELGEMRSRIHSLRAALVEKLAALGAPEFGFIQQQAGMFSYSGLSKAQVDRLREEYAIYAIGTGRICVAALSQNNLDKVAEAVYAVSRG